jgi:hypothetical protein
MCSTIRQRYNLLTTRLLLDALDDSLWPQIDVYIAGQFMMFNAADALGCLSRQD